MPFGTSLRFITLSPENSMSDQEQSAGKARRTQVMGAPFVERAMNGLDGFNRPLQEWLNEHAWGSTWLREGIDLKTRSLCTCAMLAALGKSTELKGHIRGAINNGASVVEIREILLHSAIYAGAPAAVEAFRSAREVLDELGIAIPD
jgi:4-carboxymuconolactone decarboxylase